MGGSLLRKEGAQRISTEEYRKKYVPALNQLLAPLGVKFAYIDFYREKESQGNINILVNKGEAETPFEDKLLGPASKKSFVMKFLKSKGYKLYINGDVVSFLFQDKVQIDLIFTPTSKFAFASDYFAWNDLGGLVGRVARSFGLSHGQKGLYYKYYSEDGSRLLLEYCVTDNYAEALTLLGYDYRTFKKGFNSLEEIYDFVTTSPYFSTKQYLFDEMSSSNRGREQKRQTFVKFEEYLLSKGIKRTSCLSKEDFLQTLFKKDGALRLAVFKAKQTDEEDRQIATVFNGNIVMSIHPHLEGKSLGAFIIAFKNKYDRQYLLTATNKQIEEDIRKFVF